MPKPTRERVDLEFKAVPMMPMQVGDADRIVKSLYAVCGNVDMSGDIIAAGAFIKTVNDRMPSGNIKVLWQHDMECPPIATPMVLKEIGLVDLPPALRVSCPEATGALYGEVQYLDTPRANEILAGIRGGAITQNSIGFDVIRCSYQGADGQPIGSADFSDPYAMRFDPGIVRTIQELRLWDISPVVFGANNQTMNVKAGYMPQPYQPDPDETVLCPVCGRMNDPDAMYCDQCGAAIPGGPSAPYTVDLDEPIQCPQCQRMNDVDARYCDQCDYKLAGSLDVTTEKALTGPDGVLIMASRFVQYLDTITPDLKAGRVISDANLSRLKTAHDHLTAVIAAAEPPSDDEKALTARIVEQMLRDVELAELELELSHM